MLSAVGCMYQPWEPRSALAAKPDPPLTAPAGSAIVAVFVAMPQGAGNGAYTVFDADGPIAQFDSIVAGWSMTQAKPGKHSYYVRAWSSLGCVRLDAELAASKIYVIALNAAHDRLDFAHRVPHFLSPGDAMHPAAQLGSLAYYVLDRSAARADIAAHESQKAECMAKADAAFMQHPLPLPVGFDSIDWTPPSAR